MPQTPLSAGSRRSAECSLCRAFAETPPRSRGFACRSKGDPVQDQPPVVVDQNRAVHLTASCHAGDALRSLINLAENGSNSDCRAFPPGFGALLRPSKLRDDLIVLSSRKRRCLSGNRNQSSAHASGTDIDCEQEIFLHRIGVLSLPEK